MPPCADPVASTVSGPRLGRGSSRVLFGGQPWLSAREPSPGRPDARAL